MKWLFKWMFRLALLAGGLILLFLVFKDALAGVIVENQIRARTGLEARIGKFSTGLFSGVVTIENLKLYNTADFGGTLFLDVPELHAEFDSPALAQRRLRMKLVRLNLAELNVVRNEAGRTNIAAILEGVQTRSAGGKPGASGRRGDFAFDGIDVFNLSFGKTRFIDLKDSRNNREIRVDMQSQVFKNVRSEWDARAIVFMIWLRSGGKFSITPQDPGKAFWGRPLERPEASPPPGNPGGGR